MLRCVPFFLAKCLNMEERFAMIPCYQVCKNHQCPHWNVELMDCELLPGGCDHAVEHLVEDRENQRIDGGKHGSWRWWYFTGQLSSEGCYVNGDEHGVWREWHLNGQLSYEGNYLNGEQDGLWLFWNSDGKLMSEEYYENGVKK